MEATITLTNRQRLFGVFDPNDILCDTGPSSCAPKPPQAHESGCHDLVASANLFGMSGLLSVFSIDQSKSARFRKLAIVQPTLILVRAGRKSITVGGKTLTAGPGDAIALSGGVLADVRNDTPAGGAYRADVFAVDNLDSFACAPGPISSTAHAAFVPPAGLLAQLDRLRAEASALPDSIVKHRIGEIALWLSLLGINWGIRDRPDVSFLVRDIVARDPSRSWSLTDIRALLARRGYALSDASFRRRLADEGANFRNLVIDVRLTIALQRLQSSRMSIARIAFDVGYQSPSRFAVRFRSRFGVAPSRIRGHGR